MASRARLAAAAKGDSRLGARPEVFEGPGKGPGPGLALVFALVSLASLNFEEPIAIEPVEAPRPPLPPLAIDSEYILDGCPGRTIMAKGRRRSITSLTLGVPLLFKANVSGDTFRGRRHSLHDRNTETQTPSATLC